MGLILRDLMRVLKELEMLSSLLILEKDPQQYVDDASRVGTQVAQLAQYMQKAQDEESPWAREKLVEQAQTIHAKVFLYQ